MHVPILLVLLALLLVACGGGDDDPPPAPTGTSTDPTATAPTQGRVGDLPDGVLVQVGDASITEAEIQRVLEQQIAAAQQQGQTVPGEGTPQYDLLRRNVVMQLVLQRVVGFEARRCGRPCRVTTEEVSAELQRIVQTNFMDSQQQFEMFLQQAKLSLDDARVLVRYQLQQPKLFAFRTRSVRFTAAQAREFYDANPTQFTMPAGRTARHILVRTEAQARRIRARVTDANFAAIARTASIDTGSGQQGGDLGQIQMGTLVPEFERVAFRLGDSEISQPVQTQFGWHVIQVKLVQARVTPFAEARAGIISSQLGQRRQQAYDRFQTGALEEWSRRTVYADESLTPQPPAPPPTATAPPTGTVPTVTVPTETAPPVTAPTETAPPTTVPTAPPATTP